MLWLKHKNISTLNLNNSEDFNTEMIVLSKSEILISTLIDT